MNKVISREYVEKNYVHKNKIKDKIKQLNNELKNANEVEAVFIITKQQILQELLEA